MFTKFARLVAVLAVTVSVIGNSGVAYAGRGALPPRAPQPQLLDLPALNITPASSLGVQFVHVATAANIDGTNTRTIIDHPLTNGKPDAIIIVTPNYNPGGVIQQYNNRPIGVYYNGSRWTIFNQDGAAMPVGAAFNVIIPTASTGVFALITTPSNSSGDHTFIDNSLTNSNPNARILVTPNWNPSNLCGCVNANFPIGVYYDTSASKWRIYNQDGTAMPLNAAFNVFVLPAYAGAFVQTVTADNTTGVSTYIDNALTNGNPNAILFVTPNFDPGGVCGCLNNDHNLGVWYDGSQWIIFNQDGGAMTTGASFNVLVLVPVSDIFVHTTTAGNRVNDYTMIDNALTNGHPNAIVFATQNYNPGGAGGMDDNHNIGMWYTGSQWAIFNQDSVTMPVNAAFNVLVPNPDASVLVHKTTAANTFGDETIIDYPLANGNPDAILFVTQNFNPGGVGGQGDDHPIGVFYSGSQWRIFNQDGVAIPVGAAFNVAVHTGAPGVDVFVHHAATGVNIAGHITYIDNPLTNNNPNAIIIVTPNYNPGGVGGTTDNHPIGVVYVGSPVFKWGIFNQDHLPMPDGAAFNVYVVPNYKLYLPLIMR